MMTDLTDEVLENISAFKMEGFIAEENIVNAHIDATLRKHQIQMECERAGIVMESILPERDGENIFLYILFFIPRLVRNLMNKLIELITGVPVPDAKEVQRQNELARQKADEDMAVKGFADEVCTMINDTLRSKFTRSSAYISWNGTEYVFNWRIMNVDALLGKYESYYEEYKRYDEQFSGMLKGTFNTNDEKFQSFFADCTSHLNDMLGVKVMTPGPSNTVDMTLFARDSGRSKVDTLGAQLKARANDIKKLMGEIINKWTQTDAKNPPLTQRERYIADQFIATAKSLNSDFYKMNETLMDELKSGLNALTMLPNASKTMLKRHPKITDADVEMYKKRGVYHGD